MGRLLFGHEFIDALIEHGIVPKNTTQVIIHARANELTVIHYSVLGDADLLRVIPPIAAGAILGKEVS